VNDNTPTITSGGAISVAENATAVTTVTATDADAPSQTLTYRIAGGVDAGQFSINAATGALSFVTAPDYEVPGDAGADSVYDVVVQVSDGGMNVNQSLVVRVTGVNDNVPQWSAQPGAAQIQVSTPEGVRWSVVLDATDADLPAQGLAFAITGGADAALFTLDPVSGLLTFQRIADHEVPQDANRDNAYEVEVEVGDGVLAARRTVVLRVANVNEAPVLLNSQIAVEQGGQVVLDATMLSASDPDTAAATLVYTVSEVQSGQFEQVGAGTPGQAISQFTQADVTAGRVVFVQSDVRTASASFALTVSDGALTVGPRRVVVQVQPTPEQTVPAVAGQFGTAGAAGFEGVAGRVGSGGVLTMVNDRTRLDQIMVEIAGSAAPPVSLSPVASDRQGEAPMAALSLVGDPGVQPVAVHAASKPEVTPAAPATHGTRTATLTEPARGIDPGRQTASDLLVMLDVPIDLSGFAQEHTALLQWMSAEERTRVAAESALQQKEKDNAPDLHWDSGKTLQVGSMALSVGLVFWATRATGLVASLLAVAPPWRQFDPLPVLSVHAPRQPAGTEVEWLDTDITGSLAELAEDILDQRT
ncbi:cadherin-like domain-containing protein, partial [Sphaerotilus sp.]|uniref:cadherin-like domain-containing protein n=1 Tax=Sphaerotilus sp. TaxID=2093942 RepID=UPI0025E9000C